MQFKVVYTLAFATLVAATIAPPAPGTPLPNVRASACDQGRLHCCKASQAPNAAAASGALSRAGIAANSVRGLVGLECSPTTVSRGCSSKPLCCTQTQGDLGIGCNPVIF